MHQSFAAGVAILLSIGLPAAAAETPKRGGTLTYMIPADAPPSFDGHREGTFATVHAVAPFYSVLVRANPENLAQRAIFVNVGNFSTNAQRTDLELLYDNQLVETRPLDLAPTNSQPLVFIAPQTNNGVFTEVHIQRFEISEVRDDNPTKTH